VRQVAAVDEAYQVLARDTQEVGRFGRRQLVVNGANRDCIATAEDLDGGKKSAADGRG